MTTEKKDTKKERIPSIQSLMEGNDGNDGKFGDEISKINDWFNEKYDESYQFDWDGKTLKVVDGDEKEVKTFSREDLAKKIDGFPTKVEEGVLANHDSVKALNTDIDNFLAELHYNNDIQTVKDAAKEIIDNINMMMSDIDK